MAQWTVYSRHGCSLCEEMLLELAALLGPAAAQVTVVDVSGDAELEAKYGRRVPVLLADGEFVCAYRLDGERLKAWLT
jgi:glutaredoxin